MNVAGFSGGELAGTHLATGGLLTSRSNHLFEILAKLPSARISASVLNTRFSSLRMISCGLEMVQGSEKSKVSLRLSVMPTWLMSTWRRSVCWAA